MYDINLVAHIAKGVRQAIDVHRVTAKAVWRIESSQMKEF
jgi:hypothetical protein